MKSKDLLIEQINISPEPLRSYIHEMETSSGELAHMIQELFVLREQLKQLTMVIKGG